MDICIGSRRRQIFLLGMEKLTLRKELEQAYLREAEMRRKLMDKKIRLKYEELTEKREKRLERIILKQEKQLINQQTKCKSMEKTLANISGRLLSLIRSHNEQVEKLLKNKDLSVLNHYDFRSDERRDDWGIAVGKDGFINVIPVQDSAKEQ